jgi:biofilm PGA synthesis protein PgaA
LQTQDGEPFSTIRNVTLMMLFECCRTEKMIGSKLPPNKTRYFLLGLMTVMVVQPINVAASSTHEAHDIKQRREQAILLARAGELPRAIQQLEQLYRQVPHDQGVRADLIVLCRQAGNNQSIVKLTQQQTAALLPSYAVMAWLGALRDERQYSRAQQAITQLYKIYAQKSVPDFDHIDLKLYDALISVESGNVPRAQSSMAFLNKHLAKLTTQQLSQLEYAKRLLMTLTDPREKAVAQAKRGNITGAIQQLQQLHLQYPADQKIVADLIVLLRQTGQNQQIETLTLHQDGTMLPAYAVMPLLGALRDNKAYSRAEQIILALKARYKQNLASDLDGDELDVYAALMAAESGNLEQAKSLLLALNDRELTAQQHAQLAYAYRLSQQPVEALSQAQKALAKDASNTLAIQQTVAALSDLRSADRALAHAKQHVSLFSPAEIDRLQVDTVIVRLKEAVAEQANLRRAGRYAEAKQLLDLSIADIEKTRQQLASDSPQQLRLSYDYLYALRMRERMQDVLGQFQQFNPQQQQQAPAYVRRAVADAYLAVKQPQQALELYQQLSSESAFFDPTLQTSIYFALIESEHYDQALTVLKDINKNVPNFRYSDQKGAEPLMNWDRLNTDILLAMDQAYRNHNDQAEQQLAALYAKSPKSVAVMNSYATVLRWRGHPQKADELVRLASVYDGNESSLQISTANNAKELGQYSRWQKYIEQLMQDIPEDTGVQRNFAEWKDRDRPSIQSQMSIGQSDADHVSGSRVTGNQDQTWRTRLNSPWLNDHWRLFVEHQDRVADFQDQQLDDQRIGLGLEWDSERKNAWLKLSQRIGHDDTQTGIAVGWSQWLNDHWQYRLGYDSNSSDTPLQALAAGSSTQSYAAAVTWQQNESRSASWSYQALDIDDGNLRQSSSFNLDQRLHANANHITTGGIDVYFEKNSQVGGRYFNPKSNQSVGLNLQHDWVTWRDYDQSLTQHFEVSTGLSQQSGYSEEITTDAVYQHRWQLNRTWQLNYGMGWGSHVYDGNREQRLYGVLGLTGNF